MIGILEGVVMDDLTKEQRRKSMQHIRFKDTKIEIILRKALWKKVIDTEKLCCIAWKT